MSEEREADSTPVTAEHVRKFLAWYRARIKLATFASYEEPWINALAGRDAENQLTLGQLRNGISSLQRLKMLDPVSPVAFWAMCVNRRSVEVSNRFKSMRDLLIHKQESQETANDTHSKAID